MVKAGFILLVYLILCVSCSESTDIVYNYNQEVQLAILQGVEEVRKLNPVMGGEDVYAMIYGSVETNIVLNSQARTQEPIKVLIDKSNRLILLGDTLRIPVLFISDIESGDAQQGKLYELPFTGYTIIIDRKRNLKKASLQF